MLSSHAVLVQCFCLVGSFCSFGSFHSSPSRNRLQEQFWLLHHWPGSQNVLNFLLNNGSTSWHIYIPLTTIKPKNCAQILGFQGIEPAQVYCCSLMVVGAEGIEPVCSVESRGYVFDTAIWIFDIQRFLFLTCQCIWYRNKNSTTYQNQSTIKISKVLM